MLRAAWPTRDASGRVVLLAAGLCPVVRQARRALALQKVRLAGEPESELTLTSAHWTVLERQRCCSSTC
jgi:hypothetical protein